LRETIVTPKKSQTKITYLASFDRREARRKKDGKTIGPGGDQFPRSRETTAVMQFFPIKESSIRFDICGTGELIHNERILDIVFNHCMFEIAKRIWEYI
jgi:hypothetical protein